MPLYEYKCPLCGRMRQDIRCVAQRGYGPLCDCGKCAMDLVIAPANVVVKNPAVPKRSK